MAVEAEADMIGLVGPDPIPGATEAAREAGAPTLWLGGPQQPTAEWPACDGALVPPLVQKGQWTIEPWRSLPRGKPI
jgi:hypothetical protein